MLHCSCFDFVKIPGDRYGKLLASYCLAWLFCIVCPTALLCKISFLLCLSVRSRYSLCNRINKLMLREAKTRSLNKTKSQKLSVISLQTLVIHWGDSILWYEGLIFNTRNQRFEILKHCFKVHWPTCNLLNIIKQLIFHDIFELFQDYLFSFRSCEVCIILESWKRVGIAWHGEKERKKS